MGGHAQGREEILREDGQVPGKDDQPGLPRGAGVSQRENPVHPSRH